MTDGAYSHTYRRRVEDALPEREKPKHSDADVYRFVTEAVRDALEARDSDATGVQRLSQVDQREVKRVKRTWGKMVMRVVGYVIAAGSVLTACGSTLAGAAYVADWRIHHDLVTAGLMCPPIDPDVHVNAEYACKQLPDRIGELQTAQAKTNEQLAHIVELLEKRP